jgi:Protein of unknown function (DUF3568)
MAPMKARIFGSLLILAVVVAGCVNTVNGRKTAGVPFIKDRIDAQYERPMDQVFAAAKDVVQYNGTVTRETTLLNQTNSVNGIAKIVEGKVNQDAVWILVRQADPRVTSVTVQVRTPGGGSDIGLAAELDKQVALKLVR